MDWEFGSEPRGFGITEDRGDQQPGTDVTGAYGVPSACVPPPHSFKEAKNPKPPATPSFFVPSSQQEEAVKPKVAAVHPEFQPTQNFPPVGFRKENNRKRIKLN